MQLNALFCSLWRNVEASSHKHFRCLLLQKTAAYYGTSDVSQLAVRLVVTQLVVPTSCVDFVDNTWLVAALTARTKARYRLRIAISAYPTCIRRPRKGGFRQNIATPFGTEKLEWCGYQIW